MLAKIKRTGAWSHRPKLGAEENKNRSGLRRFRLAIPGLLLALSAVAGAVASAPPASASTYCELTDSNTSYCRIETTGRGGVTGVSHVWIDWISYHTVSGKLCVTDTNVNGAGVKVNLNAHKAWEPVDNDPNHYVNLGTYKDTSTSCTWQTFSANPVDGLDFIYINWADTWSGCDYCYQGSWRVNSPHY